MLGRFSIVGGVLLNVHDGLKVWEDRETDEQEDERKMLNEYKGEKRRLGTKGRVEGRVREVEIEQVRPVYNNRHDAHEETWRLRERQGNGATPGGRTGSQERGEAVL